MTLDEYIEALRKQLECDIANCSNFDCNNCEFSMSLEEVLTNEEILSYFEELKVTRKALELACSADGMFWESEYNDYLKRARQEL